MKKLDKEKLAYLIACIVCGAAIIGLLMSMLLPPILTGWAQNRIVGVWFYDAYEGHGGQYASFTESGTVLLYAEVTLADGTTIQQDTSSLGTMTYEVLSGSEVQFTVMSMGTAITETASYQFKGNDTLILDGTTYTRYVG